MRINFNHNELPGDELLNAKWISCRGHVKGEAHFKEMPKLQEGQVTGKGSI